MAKARRRTKTKRKTKRAKQTAPRRRMTVTKRARPPKRSFRFIDAPPQSSMRRRSPASAPRLFEWLVDNGYVEPVTTYRAKRVERRARRRR